MGGITQLEAKHRRSICEKLLISLVQSVKGGVLKEGLILSLSKIETGNEVLDKALRSSMGIVKENKGILKEVPFPRLRAVEILNNAISISSLLTSLELVIEKKGK